MTHILSATAWLIALAWVYKFAEAAIGYPKVADLTRANEEMRPFVGPLLAVIVPARNEAEGIGDCITSLLGQDYEKLRVIAVDDRSTDATGEVMDGLASTSNGRLTVMHIRELPSGWLGKTHAMAKAASEATNGCHPEYLLFTDGDVIFAPGILRRAVARAMEMNADHLVVLPTLVVKTVREGAMLSYLQAMSLWAMRPWRVGDPAAKRDVVGVGAFNLVRAEAYRAIGGFDAAPMEVLEDLYLGRRMKWAGMRQNLAIAPGMVTLHWAAGARGIARGMTKNIFAVFRFRVLPLVAAAAWVALFSVGPPAFLAFPATRAAALVALMAVAGVYALSARVNRIPAVYVIFLPFAASLVAYAMVRSMFVTLRDQGVTWRGTFYGIEELRRNMVRARK